MRFLCAPSGHPDLTVQAFTKVVLYGRNPPAGFGSAGAKIWDELRNKQFHPTERAWDFLSFALSVIAADHGCRRSTSADGWTREMELRIAVMDPDFWQGQIPALERMLQFLTTDIWRLEFVDGGKEPPHNGQAVSHDAETVTLLSGGLDSLVGVIDLAATGSPLFAVSQMVRSDSANQLDFAGQAGLGDRHLQLNHLVDVPNPERPPSDRARSIIFYAYAVLLASCGQLAAAHRPIALPVPENGLISINPPLTSARIGSLSTKTTHPFVLSHLNSVLAAGGFNMVFSNPYQLKTKGEMLAACADQQKLANLAHRSTSCGRFGRYRVHCGKCLPCLIRRASFLHWGQPDTTVYRFPDLTLHTTHQRQFDDVRSAVMAVLRIEQEGLDRWLSGALNSAYFAGRAEALAVRDMVRRGMEELAVLLRHEGAL